MPGELSIETQEQMMNFLDSISKLGNHIKSRSVSAENVYGKPGQGGRADVTAEPQEDVVKIGQVWSGPNAAARELGTGWKVRPWIRLEPLSVNTLMDVDGPGKIRHIWLTTIPSRDLVLRIYWDHESTPSVEVPLADFFCNAVKHNAPILALPINVNPTNGMNSFFPMPFRKHARITLENLHPSEAVKHFYYTVNYTEEPVGEDEGYFHASFRRTNPLPYGSDFTVAEGIAGRGQFVGCYMTWQQNNDGWWGEGEMKMFIDGDTDFPTICGTGTEDYFGGAWCFNGTFSAPFFGLPFGSENKTGARHSMYRFHLPDPIYFEHKFKAVMQAIGWRSEGRYLPLQDDISAVAYWYQAEPHAPFPAFPDRNALEII
ncbi:MAG: glycoside hydrolase family 172 protein [Victivallaceae bacterium]